MTLAVMKWLASFTCTWYESDDLGSRGSDAYLPGLQTENPTFLEDVDGGGSGETRERAPGAAC